MPTLEAMRGRSRARLAFAVGWAVTLGPAAPALADPPNVPDLRQAGTNETLAWHGCWQPEPPATEADEAQARLAQSPSVCLEPGDAASSLQLRARVDGEVVAEEVLVADGSRQPVEQGGCTGWKRSLLSADRHRLFLQSETTCEGGNASRLSGVSLIVAGDRWVDIDVAEVAGERELAVRRYRSLEADLPPLPGATRSARYTARVAAAAPLEVEDVLEALDHVDPAVVEAMLVETDSRFPVDADLLVRLDDAGVPGQIIDLMLALSYPERFAVTDTTQAIPAATYHYYWGPWFHHHYYDYGYWYPYHPPASRPLPSGKAISGRGYTRVAPHSGAGGARAPGSGAASGGRSGAGASSGSGGSAGGSGYRSGGASGRRGQRR
jgi:uncharacterized membrane protein YgcG